MKTQVASKTVPKDPAQPQCRKEQFRAATHRLITAHEVERGKVALQLHDQITQPLCAVFVRNQALIDSLAQIDGIPNAEVLQLQTILGKAIAEVGRIAHKLRPSVLEHLGLNDALRDLGTEFTERTGVKYELLGPAHSIRLPPETELTLYRIVQLSLSNVEQHAKAHTVTIQLTRSSLWIHMRIQDDGIGFDPKRSAPNKEWPIGLGLFTMCERTQNLGGIFKLNPRRPNGTRIEVKIPLRQSMSKTQRPPP